MTEQHDFGPNYGEEPEAVDANDYEAEGWVRDEVTDAQTQLRLVSSVFHFRQYENENGAAVTELILSPGHQEGTNWVFAPPQIVVPFSPAGWERFKMLVAHDGFAPPPETAPPKIDVVRDMPRDPFVGDTVPRDLRRLQ